MSVGCKRSLKFQIWFQKSKNTWILSPRGTRSSFTWRNGGNVNWSHSRDGLIAIRSHYRHCRAVSTIEGERTPNEISMLWLRRSVNRLGARHSIVLTPTIQRGHKGLRKLVNFSEMTGGAIPGCRCETRPYTISEMHSGYDAVPPFSMKRFRESRAMQF